MSKTPGALSSRQLEFCRQYVVKKGNATQAAIAAGYSEKTARQIANQLLTKLDIQQAIQERMQEHFNRLKVTEQRIVDELARIAFSNIGDFVGVNGDGDLQINPWDQLEPGLTAAVQEVSCNGKIRIKLHDKIKALTLLLKLVKGWAPELEPKADMHNHLHLHGPHPTDDLIRERLNNRRVVEAE